MRGLIARIAILQSLGQPLDYLIGDVDGADVGSLVQVPLRNRSTQGIVVAITSSSSHQNLKSVERVLHTAAISVPLLRLVQWVSAYYCCRVDQVLKCALPKQLGKEANERAPLVIKKKRPMRDLRLWCQENRAKLPKQVAVLDAVMATSSQPLLAQIAKEAGVSRSPIQSLVDKQLIEVVALPQRASAAIEHEYFISKPKSLNQEQARALAAITKSMVEGGSKTHLLHGVTGSGKTEIFLQATSDALKAGKKVLILVPEISLTPQTVERFKSRFSQRLGVIHHRIKPKERFELWKQLTEGQIEVVIGARSAIFCPLHPLGLIIVDEEHEGSYKSEQLPYYHAREVLQQRALIEKATLVLASATPSLETYHRAAKGHIELLTLNQRAASAEMPALQLIDMSQERERSDGGPLLSSSLLRAIKKRQERGEQSLLFLNRRGYRSSLSCQGCQKALQCPHCDISLTFHLKERALCCHFCGKRQALIERCATCGGELTFKGWGTQHVEQSIKRCLPSARVLRADRDTTEHEGELERLLLQFATGKADVLIGTQMIGKGHHFPAVTLVGILNPDHGLHIPDFRASERLFQTITQVAGRSGRAALTGEVLMQTHLPDHDLYQLLIKADYREFYQKEIASRELFHYPPALHLIRCLIRAERPEDAKTMGDDLYRLASEKLPSRVLLSSPQIAPRARLQDSHRVQFLIKTERVIPVTRILFEICQTLRGKPAVISIDVDPDNLS